MCSALKSTLLILIFLVHQLVNGQVNLVPNPDFEDYNYCPGAFSSFSWFSETAANYWMNGSAGTSDYFNACGGDGSQVGVPSSDLAVFQPAHSGDGYAGFYVSLYDNGGWLYREYVQVKLTDSLIAGTCYYVEWWAAPSYPPDYFASGFATTDAVGAYFSEIKIGNPIISDILPYIPQVDNNATGNYIKPPGEWTKCGGVFEAAGDEAWMCIGNFHHDDFVEVIPFDGEELTDQPFCYFFLDDVLVTPVDSFLTYSMPDTVVCSPFELFAPAGLTSYLWNTGDTTESIIVTETGNYSATFETMCGTFVYDADIIFATDSVITSTTNILICTSELPYYLEASPAYDYYTWATGEHAAGITIAEPGTYYVTGYATCATFVDTFIVDVIEPVGVIPDLGNDTLICEEEWELNLSAPNGFISYTWSTGDTTENISVNDEGIYWVHVIGTCEDYTDSIIITEDPYLNTQIDLGADFELCPPIGINEYVLSTPDALPNYHWSTGETTPTITVTHAGTYWLFADLLCSTPSDTIEITACNGVGVPNAFSPNGDGVNDELIVFILDPSSILSFQIFNRWGEIIYDGGSNNYKWDGTFKNALQPMGNYVYVLRYINDGAEKLVQGNIMLVR